MLQIVFTLIGALLVLSCVLSVLLLIYTLICVMCCGWAVAAVRVGRLTLGGIVTQVLSWICSGMATGNTVSAIILTIPVLGYIIFCIWFILCAFWGTFKWSTIIVFIFGTLGFVVLLELAKHIAVKLISNKSQKQIIITSIIKRS